jgi:hypothetical protein
MGIKDKIKRGYIHQKGVIRNLDPVIKNHRKISVSVKNRGAKGGALLRNGLKRALGGKPKRRNK